MRLCSIAALRVFFGLKYKCYWYYLVFITFESKYLFFMKKIKNTLFCTIITLTLSFIYGCVKTKSIERKEINVGKLHSTDAAGLLHFQDKIVQVGYTDPLGQIIPITKKINNNNFTLEDCGDFGYAVSLTYNGFADYTTSCLDPHLILLNWTLDMPASINPVVHTGNIGRLRIKPYGFIGDPGVIWKFLPLSFSYVSTFTHPTESIKMNRYKLSYLANIPKPEYCANSIFESTFKIFTDCPDMPSIQPITPGIISESFTPDIYKVYQYWALNATVGTKHEIKADPLILLCTTCHEPSLGITPKHIFEYRLLGSSTWKTVVANNLLTLNISVPSSGDYEYRSKGLLKPDGTYSEYSTIQQVTVL